MSPTPVEFQRMVVPPQGGGMEITMEQAKLDRINEFARRVKAGETLTEEELAERAALRTEYIREFRASMTGILDNTVIIRPDGTREQVKDKKS